MLEGQSPAKETLTSCLEEVEDLSAQLHRSFLSKLSGSVEPEAEKAASGSGLEGTAERIRNRLRACAQLVAQL